jgi:hypothetical protein
MIRWFRRAPLGLALELIYARQEEMMADYTKLQASIAQLATDAATDTAAIIAALGAAPGGLDQATVDAMTASVDQADAAIAAAAAAIPTTPAPVPSALGYDPNR